MEAIATTGKCRVLRFLLPVFLDTHSSAILPLVLFQRLIFPFGVKPVAQDE
jgi:hypothetical protein